MIISHRPTKPTGKPHDHSTMAWRSSDSRLATTRLHSSEVTLMWDTNKLCVLVYCLHGSAPTCHSVCRWSHFTAIIIFICPAGVGNATYTVTEHLPSLGLVLGMTYTRLHQFVIAHFQTISQDLSTQFAILSTLQRLGGLVIKRSRVRLRPRHYSGNNPGQVVNT